MLGWGEARGLLDLLWVLERVWGWGWASAGRGSSSTGGAADP